jgi:Putative cyclase
MGRRASRATRRAPKSAYLNFHPARISCARQVRQSSRLGITTLTIRVALASALVLVGCGSFERRAPGSGPTFAHALDLTHTLDSNFPFIPVPGITFPFSLEPIATLEANGVAANRWRIHEHLGTQIDAPNHFVRGGRSLDQIRTDEKIAPVIVIDISARVAKDPDATLGVADNRLPPVGATLFIGATKVRGATGGPVRLLAVWSTPVRASFEGRWRSEQAEPLAQRGGTSYLVREFAFKATAG